MLKKARKDLRVEKKKNPFKLPARKLKPHVKAQQAARRRKKVEEVLTNAYRLACEAWQVPIDEFGCVEVRRGPPSDSEEDNPDAPKILLKKGSPIAQRVNQWLMLHDCGLSKKKNS